MNTPNDGGPAFPVAPCGTGDPRDGMTTGHDGMTLRDWFAGQALAGILASPDKTRSFTRIAEECYKQADAMLEARSANQPTQ